MSIIDEYKKIIYESFLTKIDKEFLLLHLEKNGDDKEFLLQFNNLLIAETDFRITSFEKSVQEYDFECSKLEQKYTQIKHDLEKQLENRIDSVEKKDIKKRKEIMNQYYTDLKKTQEDIKKELQSINTNYSYQFIQKAYEV